MMENSEYVASEITKNGGIAICAPIAPYSVDREINRELISKVGGYLEIFVNTSLDECISRDPKGLYKKALAGEIKGFTGIDAPYEEPQNPEIEINNMTIEESVNFIFNKLNFKC